MCPEKHRTYNFSISLLRDQKKKKSSLSIHPPSSLILLNSHGHVRDSWVFIINMVTYRYCCLLQCQRSWDPKAARDLGILKQ